MGWRQVVVVLAAILAAPSLAAGETPEQRGAYLVNGIGSCGNCHAPARTGDGPLSGGPPMSTPAFVAYAPNITPDPDTGIGTWTAAEIVTALREGRRPDGTILRPPMPVPFYRAMSDDDANAIAAYLRSIPAVANRTPPSQYVRPMPASYGPPLGHVVAPPTTDVLAYGGYLASLGHCLLCHTPLTAAGRPDTAREGAGGRKLGGSTARNITPDAATGVGAWTDEQILAALTKGVRPDGALLAPTMPFSYLRMMTRSDLDALIVWMRALKPVVNAVE